MAVRLVQGSKLTLDSQIGALGSYCKSWRKEKEAARSKSSKSPNIGCSSRWRGLLHQHRANTRAMTG